MAAAPNRGTTVAALSRVQRAGARRAPPWLHGEVARRMGERLADRPAGAGARDRLVERARRRRRRCCAGLSEGARQRARSSRTVALAERRARRRAVAALAAAWAPARPRDRAESDGAAGAGAAGVGQHEAALGADPPTLMRAVAARAGRRRLPDVLDAGPGHAGRAARALSRRRLGRAACAVRSTCTTSATCSSRPASPTR